ncbi:MAG: hypothetical protein AAF205_06950 [Pseudomonadota bacterium]
MYERQRFGICVSAIREIDAAKIETEQQIVERNLGIVTKFLALLAMFPRADRTYAEIGIILTNGIERGCADAFRIVTKPKNDMKIE